MSQEDELVEALESVHDEETFLQFLLALRDDREASVAQEKVNPGSPYGADAGGWNSTTIELFLDTDSESLRGALAEHREYIATETLATTWAGSPASSRS